MKTDLVNALRLLTICLGGISVSIIALTIAEIIHGWERGRLHDMDHYRNALAIFVVLHFSVVIYLSATLILRWNQGLSWYTVGAAWIFFLKLVMICEARRDWTHRYERPTFDRRQS